LSERTRSFAAFQLGMWQAREAATLLLETARNRGELRSVRHYAIYALGMLRQRSLIEPLMDIHSDESDDPVIRDALTNSILFMMGVTE
jgi:HEAT repeat protein